MNGYVTQRITSSNWNSFAAETGFVPPGTRVWPWQHAYRWQMAGKSTRKHTDWHLAAVKPLDFFPCGRLVLQICPPRAISGQTHGTAGQHPHAYQIITFLPTTPQPATAIPHFIALPQDFTLYMLNFTDRRAESVDCRGIVYRRRNIAPTIATGFVDMSHTVTNDWIIYADRGRSDCFTPRGGE